MSCIQNKKERHITHQQIQEAFNLSKVENDTLEGTISNLMNPPVDDNDYTIDSARK